MKVDVLLIGVGRYGGRAVVRLSYLPAPRPRYSTRPPEKIIRYVSRLLSGVFFIRYGDRIVYSGITMGVRTAMNVLYARVFGFM
jgi:hypothetical protein